MNEDWTRCKNKRWQSQRSIKRLLNEKKKRITNNNEGAALRNWLNNFRNSQRRRKKRKIGVVVTTWCNMIGNSRIYDTRKERGRKWERERKRLETDRARSLTSSRDFPQRSHRCTLCTCVHASITRSPSLTEPRGERGWSVGGAAVAVTREGGELNPRHHQLRPRLQLYPPTQLSQSSSRVGSIDRPSDIAPPPLPRLSTPLPSLSRVCVDASSFCPSFAGSCISYFSSPPLSRRCTRRLFMLDA